MVNLIGMEMRVRIGDQVEPHQPLVDLLARTPQSEPVAASIQEAISIEPQPTPAPDLILDELVGL